MLFGFIAVSIIIMLIIIMFIVVTQVWTRRSK